MCPKKFVEPLHHLSSMDLSCICETKSCNLTQVEFSCHLQEIVSLNSVVFSCYFFWFTTQGDNLILICLLQSNAEFSNVPAHISLFFPTQLAKSFPALPRF